MTPPTLTPAEQIRRFVEQHPGEWQEAPSPYVGSVLPLPSGYDLMLVAMDLPHVALLDRQRPWSSSWVPQHWPGHGANEVDVLRRVVSRAADSMLFADNLSGGADLLPSWLADPVRRELRRRAGDLLTLAGSSPADVVSAAETLDEYLAARPPVPMDGGAICNALMEIGMSCRWVADPAVNAEREALQDARVALSCADATMTREQLLDLAANLRRVLGVA